MRHAVTLGLALFCATLWRPAHGQTCTVGGTTVAFGPYAPLSGSGVSTTGTVTVTCNPGIISVNINYTISMSIGGAASYATRSMGGPTPRLRYQLYRDSGDTQIWGDGTAGTFTVADGDALGIIFPISKNYTVYGVIAANTTAAIGSYMDSITLTISY